MCVKSKDRRTISLGFTDERVLEGQHICYIYKDDSERLRVMAKFFESGLQMNEKMLYLVDAMTPDEMLECLEELGVDVRSKPAALTMKEAASTYCPHGVFTPQEILDLARDFYLQAVNEEGYAGARGTGEMSWCLVEGRTDRRVLMEYEAHLDILLAEYPVTACCQYDARRFDGNTIMDVLALHPVTIIHGQLVKNPYYIGTERFLREYNASEIG
ncbi:MAG: MEDS domain-containing protein [Pirellulales bacterium]|nr:MEDS domain-containing protein [Pirellulales bacterium]